MEGFGAFMVFLNHTFKQKVFGEVGFVAATLFFLSFSLNLGNFNLFKVISALSYY